MVPEPYTLAGREALLEEDVPDDEAAEELAPITAQLAYAHSELGRRDKALAAYQVGRRAPAHWSDVQGCCRAAVALVHMSVLFHCKTQHALQRTGTGGDGGSGPADGRGRAQQCRGGWSCSRRRVEKGCCRCAAAA